MAKFFQTKRTKKRLITAMSVMLAASCAVGALAACGETTPSDDDDDDNTSVAATDTQLIKNGNFEFYTEAKETDRLKKLNLISSPDSWSRTTASDGSGSAPTSESASGIVNTADWDYFTRPGRPFESVEDALANWTNESVTAYDRIKFYDENKISSKDDFEYYDDYKYTIDYDDIKNFYGDNTILVQNPLTHDSESEEKSVLMIQNKKKSTSSGQTVYGTAQYYSSSTTVTVPTGAAAELSLWVKTSNLVHWEELEAKSGCGAYIEVANTVGGSTLDKLQIKNINTEVLNPDKENNGWVNYKLYVRASTYASTTVKVTLGLGMGSSANMDETVDGYAFFDDLTCTLIPVSTYEEKTTDIGEAASCDISSYAEEKIFKADKLKTTNYALDLSAGFEALTPASNEVSIDLTKQIFHDAEYTTETYKPLSIGKDPKSYTKFASLDTMKTVDNAILKSVLEKDFEKYPFDSTKELVMLMSNNGAPYTATLTSSKFTVGPDAILLVSFFVKTSAMDGFTGAGITLVDGQEKTSISSIDSTTIDPVDIDDSNKDIYDGWTQCFFFVSNEEDTAKTFELQFTYGSTTIVGTAASSYTDGYAAFANFETYDLSKRENSYVSTGDRAKAVTLQGNTVTGSSFGDAALNDPTAIETDMAEPAEYWGVTPEDGRITGTAPSDPVMPNQKPEKLYAGLINSDYEAAYKGLEWQKQLATIAHQNGVLADASLSSWWQFVVGTAKQPLLILNQAEAAYGYIARTSATISSSTYQKISVRVKVSDNAKAFVYLVDASSLGDGYDRMLTQALPALTYWYDDDGNVCTKDPSDEKFDKKKDYAYLLQKNGLYKNADDDTDTKYYANLSNYKKDDDGNLVTSEDTIAFFAHDGKYYAYYDKDKDTYSTEVFDFNHEYARYDYSNVTYPENVMVVDGTKENVKNKWVNVNFYVHTGDTAKKYRLEVWSGSRDGEVKNPANSYVLFDNVTSTTVDSDYESLLSEAEAAVKESLGVKKEDNISDTAKAIYYTYTFYDDADYLRYDETADTDETGNPYASYKQSSHEEELIYLYYEDTTSSGSEYSFNSFVDYAATEVTVERDTTDDSDDDTEEPDDTATDTASYNVWLLASSGALVGALFIVIISLAVRKAMKKRRSTPRAIKPHTEKKKPEKQPKAQEEPAPAPKDENDPYNE